MRFCESLVGNGQSIAQNEFAQVVAKYLPRAEDIRLLFQYLDVHKVGRVDVRNLVSTIRGPIGYMI